MSHQLRSPRSGRLGGLQGFVSSEVDDEKQEPKPQPIGPARWHTDEYGNEVETRTFEDNDAAEELEKPANFRVPKTHTRIAGYHRSAPFGHGAKPNIGKGMMYQRTNDPKAAMRQGFVYAERQPLDMQGRTMKNVNLGPDVGFTPKMRSQFEGMMMQLLDSRRNQTPVDPAVIDRVRSMSRDEQRLVMNVIAEEDEHIERSRSRSMSRLEPDEPMPPPPPAEQSLEDKRKEHVAKIQNRLTMRAVHSEIIQGDALHNQPTVTTALESMAHQMDIDSAQDNLAAAADMAGVDLSFQPRFVPIQEVLYHPKVGSRARTAKRGRGYVGTVINKGTGSDGKEFFVVKFADDVEEKVFEDDISFAWQEADFEPAALALQGPRMQTYYESLRGHPAHRNKSGFDPRYDAAMEVRDGHHHLDDSSGYRGNALINDLSKLETIRQEDPQRAARIDGPYVVVSLGKAVANPRMAQAQLITANIHTEWANHVQRAAHTHKTGAASPEEVRRAAAISHKTEPEVDEAPPRRRRRTESMHRHSKPKFSRGPTTSISKPQGRRGHTAERGTIGVDAGALHQGGWI